MFISPSIEIVEKGVCVSIITASIIFAAFACYIGFQALKNFQLRNLNASLAGKDFETVEKLAEMPLSKKILGGYTCDLYQLRALYLDKDRSKFEHMLRHMLATTYPNPEDKKSFLEQYFHTFLLKGNAEYAGWILDSIRTLGEEALTRYTEQAYAVMVEHRTDLIETMNEQINSKQYYGFALGVILFMIAKQYEALQDTENAVLYYENAKICFHPKALYVPCIDESLKCLGKPDKELQTVHDET